MSLVKKNAYWLCAMPWKKAIMKLSAKKCMKRITV